MRKCSLNIAYVHTFNTLENLQMPILIRPQTNSINNLKQMRDLPRRRWN
uniref:Uncharacterized protein n=1 Tax=Rhizophora mucronata TaxID=61149 RepID=A0A2P2P9D2_RHIMU